MLKLRNLSLIVLFFPLALPLVSVFAAETILLEFGGPACPHCRNVESLVQELIQQGYPIRQIDAYQNMELATQYKITQLPTFIMLVDGKEADRMNGAAEPVVMKTRLLQMLELGRPQAQNGISVVSTPSNFLSSIQSVNAEIPMALPPVQLLGSLPQQPTLSQSRILQATVRIRVDGVHNHDLGTGTIIDARNGKALILTCGHIFRDSQGKGEIEVNIFGEDSWKKLRGELVQYNDQLDIAFVAITPPFPVSTVPLAPVEYLPKEGDFTLSTGCDGGGEPTPKRHQIQSVSTSSSATNPAFYFIQVDNPPAQGRSGGGLFSQNGYLIGVCNAADERGGFFAPLKVIRSEMDRANMTAIYQSPSAPPAVESVATPPMLAEEEKPLPLNPIKRVSNESPADSLSHVEQATLDEIKRHQQDGAEIICVIRSKRDPNAPSDVIQLQTASPQFINALHDLSSSHSTEPAIQAPSSFPQGSRIPTSFPVNW